LMTSLFSVLDDDDADDKPKDFLVEPSKKVFVKLLPKPKKQRERRPKPEPAEELAKDDRTPSQQLMALLLRHMSRDVMHVVLAYWNIQPFHIPEVKAALRSIIPFLIFVASDAKTINYQWTATLTLSVKELRDPSPLQAPVRRSQEKDGVNQEKKIENENENGLESACGSCRYVFEHNVITGRGSQLEDSVVRQGLFSVLGDLLCLHWTKQQFVKQSPNHRGQYCEVENTTTPIDIKETVALQPETSKTAGGWRVDYVTFTSLSRNTTGKNVTTQPTNTVPFKMQKYSMKDAFAGFEREGSEEDAEFRGRCRRTAHGPMDR